MAAGASANGVSGETARCDVAAVCDREACSAAAENSCGGCKAAAYCGRGCQEADWRSRHRFTCAALPPAIRGVTLRLAAAAEKSALCLRAERRNTSGALADGSFEGFYRHPAEARRSLGLYLRQLAGGPLAVDDALFAQLVAAAEEPPPEKDGEAGPLVFAVGRLGPWLAMRLHRGRAASGGGKATLRPGLLAPADPAARRRVGGLWVSGPDAKNRYLGIGQKGPLRLTLEVWHAIFIQRVRDRLSGLAPEVQQIIKLLLADDLDFSAFELRRSES